MEDILSITNTENKISYILYEICLKLSNNKELKTLDINNFVYLFNHKHYDYKSLIQQDAHEFTLLLLDDISIELNRVKNCSGYKNILYTNPQSKIQCEKEFYAFNIERENSIIIDIFYSTIMTKFICICNNKTYSFQKILDFPLILPKHKNNIDLLDLLKHHFSDEYVDFETTYEKCKKKLKHKKNIVITRPPKILIFSLQRFNYHTNLKNECNVSFRVNLNIKEFIDNDFGFNNNSIYYLYSVINHLGFVNFGHYFTLIKLNNNLWFKFDDEKVT